MPPFPPMPMLDPSCPWSGWQRQSVQLFCEAPRCGWVEAPVNAYSSVVYVLVAVVILADTRRQRTPHLAGPGLAALVVAMGSFFFHASSSVVGGFVDFGSMFLFSTWAVVGVAHRVADLRGSQTPWSVMHRRVLFWAICVPSVVVLIALGGHGSEIFAVHIAVISALEVYLIRHQRTQPAYRHLVWLVLCFGASMVLWWLDVARIVCDEDQPFLQAHAGWHLLSAPCFWFLYRFYASAPLLTSPR